MILAILQARVSSTRLPGKVMKPILGRPMLERQLERLQRCRRIDRIVVATSTELEDDAIAALCKEIQIDCFRGSLDDVLDRFYRAALPYHPEHIVRLTGDCPLADPDVIDSVIDFYCAGGYDYASNARAPFTFPDGLDVEVFRFAHLEMAWREATLPSYREHVTPFLSKHPERFTIGNFQSTVDRSHLRWTVDEPADFTLVERIYEMLYPQNPAFGTEAILRLFAEHPELMELSTNFERNAGKKKSLEADQKFLKARGVFSINSRPIGPEHPTYLIAEMGINHNGEVDRALQMVDMVARSGADAIKIQIVNAEQSYAHDSESYAIFKKVELPLEAWERVVARARELRLDIFASFAHPDDVALVERFNFPAVKVSSSNITNFPLLRAVAATGRPIILSTGLAYMSEVDEAVRYLESEGSGPIALLHCTALYPTPPERVNLRAMDTLGRAFPYPVGLSDHTRGATCAIAAVALGARIIEKHVTLDRNLPGPDHAFSATPDELALLVRGVREVVMALGSPVKEPVPEEVSLRQKFQRTIVAARDIHPGEVLTYENLAAKRCPHPGLAPKHLDVLIGRKVTRMIVRDAPVSFDIL